MLDEHHDALDEHMKDATFRRGWEGGVEHQKQSTKEPKECGWAKLYHPRGPQITLPVPGEPKAAFAWVSAALDAGWLTTAPGLEEGEEKELVGWVLKGETSTPGGEPTPFILLYSANEKLTWSFLKVYLNTPADRAAFEYASKIKVAELSEYVGNDKPQRGAAAKTDRYIVPAPKPFGVVWKKNPKHDDSAEGKMKPARLFVRWVDQAAEPKPAEGNGETRQAALTSIELKDWRDHIKTLNSPEDMTTAATQLRQVPAGSQLPLKKLLMEQARAHRCIWDKQLDMFCHEA